MRAAEEPDHFGCGTVIFASYAGYALLGWFTKNELEYVLRWDNRRVVQADTQQQEHE